MLETRKGLVLVGYDESVLARCWRCCCLIRLRVMLFGQVSMEEQPANGIRHAPSHLANHCDCDRAEDFAWHASLWLTDYNHFLNWMAGRYARVTVAAECRAELS